MQKSFCQLKCGNFSVIDKKVFEFLLKKSFSYQRNNTSEGVGDCYFSEDTTSMAFLLPEKQYE
jgi:hypothetical protein